MDCWDSQVGGISIEMDNGCALLFYALSFLIENCINLVFYNGECQRGVHSSLLEKKRNRMKERRKERKRHLF